MDTADKPLSGEHAYTMHATKKQLPAQYATHFWSVIAVDSVQRRVLPNALKRYSLGTKNKDLKSNPDGSLTLYTGAKSPGKDKESNWLPAPEGTFSLYIRAYWPEKAVLDGTWMPPHVERVK